MDPRERADATLARARARGTYVVTPESAISPMDAANTLQIPRSVVAAIDHGDPEATMVVPVIAPEVPLPAIAQEASTQVLASPMPRKAQPREDTSTPPMGWAPPVIPGPPPEPEQVDGLVPTVKPAPHPRSTLSQRLDG